MHLRVLVTLTLGCCPSPGQESQALNSLSPPASASCEIGITLTGPSWDPGSTYRKHPASEVLSDGAQEGCLEAVASQEGGMSWVGGRACVHIPRGLNRILAWALGWVAGGDVPGPEDHRSAWAGGPRDEGNNEVDAGGPLRALRQPPRGRPGGVLPLRLLQASPGGEDVFSHA